MDFHAKQIAPPKSWETFEDLCLALFRAVWRDPSAQKNGRAGQVQNGVDIFGCNHALGGEFWGVCCIASSQSFDRSTMRHRIVDGLAKAEQFMPRLAHYVIATTGQNDAAIQQYTRILNAERAKSGLFPISIIAWEEIQYLLSANPDIAKHFYPEHFVNLAAANKPSPFRLSQLRLTQYFSDPLNQLRELRRQFETQGSSADRATACVILQGMGGVGKTQLALKYSHEFRADYAGVWWFYAESSSTLEQECRIFCDINDIYMPQGEQFQTAMTHWLANQSRWLLVFDDAEESKTLQDYLPHTGQHHVLVTTRQSVWPGMQVLHVDVWHGIEPLSFLRQRLPKASDDERRQLSNALDGLPLALEQACAFLSMNRITVSDYIARVNTLEFGATLLKREDSRHSPRSVLASLSLVFGKLSEPARALLQLCAWLAVEPIPEYLFTDNPDSLPEVLHATVNDAFAWRETVAELEHYALCRVLELTMTDYLGNNGEAGFYLVFHRLTQAAIRDWEAPTNTMSNMDACAKVVALLYAAFPSRAAMAENWPRCRALMPHVQGLDAYYSKAWVEQPRYASLLGQLANYMAQGPALFVEAERLAKRALAIYGTALGEEQPATLIAMNSLAEILLRQGKLSEALPLHKQVLAITCRTRGEQHPNTLAAMNNLAVSLEELRDFSAAKALREAILRISRDALGEEHPSTANAMSNLALTHYWQGDIAGAQALQESALSINRQILGTEHPSTFTAMANLAATLYRQGDLAGAKKLLEQLLSGSRRVLGAQHPSTLEYKEQLTSILDELGESTEVQALRNDDGVVTDGTAPNPARHFAFWRDDDASADHAQFMTRHRTWLKHLELENFRCFAKLKIEFDPQITVLVAQNGAGKTTVLDAIAIAFGLFVDNFNNDTLATIIDADVRVAMTTQISQDLREMEPQYPVAIQAVGEIDAKPLAWLSQRRAPKAPPNQLGPRQIMEIGTAMQKAVTKGEPVVLPLIAYYGTNRLRDRMSATVSADDQEYERAFFSRTAGYQNCLNPSASYQYFEKWFVYAAKADADLRNQMNEQTGARNGDIDTAYTPLLKAVSQAVDCCLGFSGWKNIRFSFVHRNLVMEHQEHGILEIEQLSDGVRNMIAMAADIAHRTVRLNASFGRDAALKTPGLVLIDEVDLHLHPAWQQVALENLVSAFPCIQFVVTTHSPQVISTVASERIRILADGEVFAAPKGTQGAESSRILKRVFGVELRPPNNENTKLLDDYLKLVFADKWNDPLALEMRKKLDAIFSDEEPELTRADLHIENRQWELSNEEDQ